MVSQAWRKLTAEDKKVYEEMSIKDKARYEVESSMYEVSRYGIALFMLSRARGVIVSRRRLYHVVCLVRVNHDFPWCE